MAKTGMKKLVAAAIATSVYGELPTYSTGFMVGAAIEGQVTINNSDTPLWADNRRVNEDRTFTDGTITLGIDEFGDGTLNTKQEIEALLRGAKKVTSGGVVSVNYGETPKLTKVGLGWFEGGKLRDDTGPYYDAYWYHQVQFGGGLNKTANTKNGTVNWQTPTITGTIIPVEGYDPEQNIYTSESFTTEGEAVVWLHDKANIQNSVAELKQASAAQLYAYCQDLSISSVTVNSESVSISSAASITDGAVKAAVAQAVYTAQTTPATSSDNG